MSEPGDQMQPTGPDDSLKVGDSVACTGRNKTRTWGIVESIDRPPCRCGCGQPDAHIIDTVTVRYGQYGNSLQISPNDVRQWSPGPAYYNHLFPNAHWKR